jgi:hypothetical protein
MSNTLDTASPNDGNTIPINITDPSLTGQPVDIPPPTPNSGLTPTGAKIILPVPALKTNLTPLFYVRLNPMLLTYATWTNQLNESLPAYFFPLQFPYSPDRRSLNVKMLWELTYNEHIYNMMTHRFMTGQIDCVLRISSNVNVTGSISVTEVQDVPRSFDCFIKTVAAKSGMRYMGYRPLPVSDTNNLRVGQSQTMNAQAHVHNSFALNDLSLTRHFELSSSYTFGETMFDHHLYYKNLKTYYENFGSSVSNTKDLTWNYTFAHLFKENLLIVSPLTDITSEPGQLTFELLLDFSKVQYHGKLLDLVPYGHEAGNFTTTDIVDVTQYYHLVIPPPPKDASTQTDSKPSDDDKKIPK